MGDALYWFASNQGRLDACLRCPNCGVNFVTAAEPENNVPRKVQPCQCVVCTKCATEMSVKSPCECPKHKVKLNVLATHQQYPKAKRVIKAMLMLERLKQKADVQARPRALDPQTEEIVELALGGAFKMLVYLVGRFDSPTKQRAALKGLQELAGNPTAAEQVALSGALQTLVQVLKQNAPLLKMLAAQILKLCAAVSPECQKSIEESGAIQELVKLAGAVRRWFASPAGKKLQEICVSALFEVAGSKSVSDKVVDAGGIDVLLKAMKGGNSATKSLSAGTLGKLAIDIDLLVELASKGKIPPLVRLHSAAMSPKAEPAVAQASSNLLAKLAAIPQASQEVVNTQAVPTIMQTVANGTAEAQQDAVRGLAVIATNPIMDAPPPGYPIIYGNGTIATGFMQASKTISSLRNQGSSSPRGLTLETQRMSPGSIGNQSSQNLNNPFGTMSRFAQSAMSPSSNPQNLAQGPFGRLGPLPLDVASAGVPALLKMLKTSSGSQQEQILAVLRDLAFSPQQCQLIAKNDGIHILADTLTSNLPHANSVHAASCLRSIALDLNLAAMIGDSGVIPCLIKLLSDDTPEGQDSGIGALANLAVIPRNRELIADAGGIEAVIKLLGQTGIDEEVLNMTVGTLANLATLPANQVTIAASGGVPALLKHLQSNSQESQVIAAGALWSLAQNSDNQARIAHWGGIPCLIELLKQNNQQLRLHVLGCLRYMAENEDHRVLIKKAGGVPILVQLFVDAWSGREDLQEMACKCLLNLSISFGNQVSIVENGCLPSAARFLSRGSPVAQEYSAGLILNLASNSQLIEVLNKSGVIAGLVKVLDSGSSQAQGNGIEALRNLSVDPAACRQIQQASQASGIDLIVQQLCSHSLHNAWHAACVLANLAACNLSTYHDAIANAGALEPLLALLKGTKEEQSAALGALRNLTSDIKWQKSSAKRGAIPMLTKGLRHPDPDTRECAAAAIGNLAAGNASFSNVDGEKMVIVNLLEAAVQPLMTLCKANSSGPEEDCAASAAGALWRMIAAENVRGGQNIKMLLSSPESQAILTQMLRSGSTRGRDNSFKALELLNRNAANEQSVGNSSKTSGMIHQQTPIEIQAHG